jgi:large subunit ribosomal protein L22
MKASLRNVRISPKKVNLVAELVRTADVDQALALLEFTPKKAAKILYKVVASAKANAETNDNAKASDLFIKEIKVSKGMTIKRFIPISRGRAHPINKFCSHIHVILADKNQEIQPASKKEVEQAEKAAPKKEVAKKAPAKKAATKASNKK